MARGPLPSPTKRRANAPTIPSTELAAGGRKGRAPACPYPLAEAGRAWWKWAWKLPQSLAWDDGALYFVARRAQLEDDVAALNDIGSLDLADALGVADRKETVEQVEWIMRALKSLAGGKTSLIREMRELDNRLGLNPKGLADLRWTIVSDEGKPERKKPPSGSGRRSRLSVVA